MGVVDRGKVIALGTPKELVDTLGGNQIVEVTLADPPAPELLDQLRARPSVIAVRMQAGRIVLTVDELHVALPKVIEDLEQNLVSLEVHHATLEDVFVSLTGRHLREQ